MKIRGKVFSGLGLGAFYVRLPQYKSFFTELLQCDVFEGTLNIELENTTWKKIRNMKKFKPTDGNLIFYTIGRVYNDRIIILRPSKSRHPENVIEIVACDNLRKKYDLLDGDTVIISIE